MPVFRSGKGQAPAWCELEYFDILELPTGATYCFTRMGNKEKLIIGAGQCRLQVGGHETTANEREQFDLGPHDPPYQVVAVAAPVVLIRMAGRWGDELGKSGVFSVTQNYAFDNHYHDCDEYWILYAGRGKAVSEGREYTVGPGDCLATGMGWHHDFPEVYEPVQAVYFETTLEGQKRRGHLWEHQHGPAAPKQERI